MTARRTSRDDRQNGPLSFDKLLIDTMLLVGGAVLTPRLLARTLDLQIRVNSTHRTSRKTENPLTYFPPPTIDARIRDSGAPSSSGPTRRRDLC
jgi:hypothetical protein